MGDEKRLKEMSGCRQIKKNEWTNNGEWKKESLYKKKWDKNKDG